MNIFNIGPGEFFLLLILLLIIFGPQRLPELARKAGKALRDIRKFAGSFDPELLAEFRDLTKDINDMRTEVTTLRNDMVGIQSDIQGEISGALKDANSTVDEAIKDAKQNTAVALGQDMHTSPANPLPAGSSYYPPLPKYISAPSRTAYSASNAASGAVAAVAAETATAVESASGSTVIAEPELLPFEQDEIVGTLLTVEGKVVGLHIDEIVGKKIFPLPRQAAHAHPASSNGHDDNRQLHARRKLVSRTAQLSQPPTRKIASSAVMVSKRPTPPIRRVLRG